MPKTRREYVDYDYLDQLPEDAKKFLDDFSSEYYGASVKGGDKVRLNKFHKTELLKKSVTDANNARNRDMYGIAKASNLVHDDFGLKAEANTKVLNYDLYEQAAVSIIDDFVEEEDHLLFDFFVFYNPVLNKIYISKESQDKDTHICLGLL